MPGVEVGVNGDDYGAVLLGHWRDGVAIVSVGQVLLGVDVGL